MVELFLYDPMPGGSGLLNQVVEHWPRVREAALELCRRCPGGCEHSCYECLRSFWNAIHHGVLDRHGAAELLEACPGFVFEHEVGPSAQEGGTAPEDGSTNPGEYRLGQYLAGAGLPEPIPQHSIVLEPPIQYGSEVIRATTPDHAYLKDRHGADIAIYLDGQQHRHRRARDGRIRDELRDLGWSLVEIPTDELGDPAAMGRHVQRLARLPARATRSSGP